MPEPPTRITSKLPLLNNHNNIHTWDYWILNCILSKPTEHVKHIWSGLWQCIRWGIRCISIAQTFSLDFILIGGFVEDRMLSKEQLVKVSKLPLIDNLRGELVAILGSLPTKTSQLLSHQQTMLSMNLTQYVKDKQGMQTGESWNTLCDVWIEFNYLFWTCPSEYFWMMKRNNHVCWN